MPGHLIELYGMLETGFHTYTRFSDDPQKVNGTIGRVVSSMELQHPRRAGQRRADAARSARSRRWAPACISATTTTPPPTRRRSRRTAGSAPATSAASSTRPATCEIVGRRKEIINRGGKKFFPREVEEILYTHPEGPARGHGRRRRSAARRAQLPVRRPEGRADADAGRDGRASSRARWPTTSCPRRCTSSRSCPLRRPAS